MARRVMACVWGFAGLALAAAPALGASAQATRTRADVQAIIQKAGTTPPEWWDAVPLDYPKTLDLSWPEKPPGQWNAQKNVGQYLWSVINENPSHWRSGIRFLHYLLTYHKDNPGPLGRAMEALAGSYFNLFQDHARAAFWWQKVAQRRELHFFEEVRLAECYWRLGNKEMASAELKKIDEYVSASQVKLWSDMGDLDKALKLAGYMTSDDEPSTVADGHLAAGDACRVHGQFQQALTHYGKVMAIQPVGKWKGGIERCRKRAQANAEAVKLYDALDLKRIPDGTYTARSDAYVGPLQVAVAVKAGRIESVRVTQHQDKQYYTSIAEIPRRIVAAQSVQGIDAVTSATITCEAIVNATAKALAGAVK